MRRHFVIRIAPSFDTMFSLLRPTVIPLSIIYLFSDDALKNRVQMQRDETQKKDIILKRLSHSDFKNKTSYQQRDSLFRVYLKSCLQKRSIYRHVSYLEQMLVFLHPSSNRLWITFIFKSILFDASSRPSTKTIRPAFQRNDQVV